MTSARSGIGRHGTPVRASSSVSTPASAGGGRRLQMARPNRSVLNTEAPPQVGRSCPFLLSCMQRVRDAAAGAVTQTQLDSVIQCAAVVQTSLHSSLTSEQVDVC